MKTIQIPQGYEFSHVSENEIILKEAEKKYPLSIDEVKDRYYNFTTNGNLTQFKTLQSTSFSTTDRAKAMIALGQLVELRDAWNSVDGFVVDWINADQTKYCIKIHRQVTFTAKRHTLSEPLYFGSEVTAKKFLTQFNNLITTAKELL